MIAVPALRYLGEVDTKRSHATAVAVMLPLSALSAVTYSLGGLYDLRLGAVSSLGVSLGGCIGAFLLSRLRSDLVALVFYLSMSAAGIYGVWQWFG